VKTGSLLAQWDGNVSRNLRQFRVHAPGQLWRRALPAANRATRSARRSGRRILCGRNSVTRARSVWNGSFT